MENIWHNTQEELPEANREILYKIKKTNKYHEYHECGVFDIDNNEFISNMAYYNVNEIEQWCYVDDIK